MNKKTSVILPCIFLGLLIVLCTGFGIFACVIRRAQFLAEGDLAMAEFCIQFGSFFFILDFIFIAVIWHICSKNRRTSSLYEDLTRNAPQFEKWLTQEIQSIKEKYKTGRTIAMIAVALVTLTMFPVLILILDGGPFLLTIMNIVVYLCILLYVDRFFNYKKQYIKPLLYSALEVLSAKSEKEAFAEQILGEDKDEFTYYAAPQMFESRAWVLPDYCYIRQSRKTCIIKNKDIQKAVLKKVTYTQGMGRRTRFKHCYAIEVFTGISDTKPFFRAYFNKDYEMYEALAILRSTGLPDAKIEDMTDYENTEEGRRERMKSIIISVIMVIAMIALAKYCLQR